MQELKRLLGFPTALEKALGKERARSWSSFVEGLSTGIEEGALLDNTHEYRYDPESIPGAQKRSMKLLQDGFIGANSSLLTVSFPITAATLNRKFSEILGTDQIGGAFSQRDIFRPEDDSEPEGEKSRRLARISDSMGDFYRNYNAAVGMKQLRLQLSTHYDRERNLYIVFATKLEARSRNRERSKPEAFLEATGVNRLFLFGAVFQNPEDLTDPTNMALFESGSIGQRDFISAIGNPAIRDVTTLGEQGTTQDFVHHMFI